MMSSFRRPLVLLLFVSALLASWVSVPTPAEARTRRERSAQKADTRKPTRQPTRRSTRRSARSRAPKGTYLYQHTICRGDTIAKVAKKYGVTSEQVMEWNDLPSSHLIREGRTLTVYSKKRLEHRERGRHTVKKGESLAEIAKKYGMKVGELRSLNGLSKDMLRTGQALVVLVRKSPDRAPSDRDERGRRRSRFSGVQLTSGIGFKVRNPERAWGTDGAVSSIRRAFREVRRRYNGSVAIIGDISREAGGRLRPHRSHQRGLDVDIGFYRVGVTKERSFHRVTPKTMDARRTWALLHAFLKAGNVDMVFVDYSLQKPLYDEAKRVGVRDRELAEYFQYPRGKRARDGLVRHEPGHADHIHVRFQQDGQRTADREDDGGARRSGAQK